ncbi:hypothetical protein GOODEAATRI_019865, partial [Goodea atripinnis]
NFDNSSVNVEEELTTQVMAVYLAQDEFGHVDDLGIVIASSILLNCLGNLSKACYYLLGLTYALDLTIPNPEVQFLSISKDC